MMKGNFSRFAGPQIECSGAWQEAQPAAPAAAVPVEDGVPEDAAPQIEGFGWEI